MSEHKGNTDKVNKVNLTSAVEQVVWSLGAAAVGGKAGIEVYTQFVGNNSEMSIKISDKSGKTFDTIKKKMFGNKFWTEIAVPEKAKDELYAEVKFSKLGIEKKSNSLRLLPPIELKNLKWDKKEAKRGDILKITAEVKRIADGNEAEVQIWEYDADEAHEMITKFPVIIKNQKIETEWEFQYRDDTENIPTEDEAENGYKNPEYFFRISLAGVSKDSELLKFKDYVELKILDENNNPIANEDVTLITPDSKKQNLKTDSDGVLKVEDIPPGKLKIEFPKYTKKK